MRRLTRRTAAALAVYLGIIVPTGSAFADGSPVTRAATPTTTVMVDNSAVSVNTTDNSSVFHLAFTVVHSSGTQTDVSNVAVAVADCANCRSTAIAIEVDLVWPVPAVLTAENVAVAITSGCVTCDALAAAFQYVIASDQRMVLTRRGRHEVRQIEAELAALRSSVLSTADLTAQIDSLASQLGNVLATELVPVKHRGDADRAVEVRRDDRGRDDGE